MASVYSTEFFESQRDGSFASAAVILPILVDIFRPRSLIDVGCGQGTWTKTGAALGIEDQIGVDGAWARPSLQVPEDMFRACDLGAPFDLGRRFDLAISMEVGEHIAADRADVFVGNIVRHADAVVFSAAAPYQGGVHHVNEQWPTYWARKFAQHDYRCFDFLRWRIWNDRRVATWYRQNVLIFANRHNDSLVHRLESQAVDAFPAGVPVIHPEMWTAMMNSKGQRLQRMIGPALRGLLPKAKRAHKPQLSGKL